MTTEDPNQKTMSLLDHLIELRTRFVYSLAVVFIAFLLCYAVSEHLFRFLAQPLADIFAGQDRRMIFTGLTEGFFTYLKISLWGALFLAFPFILLQAWSFIAPGLYHQEKKAFLPFMIATPFLFFLGGALVYYLVFPLAWTFFLSFESPALGTTLLPIELEARIGEYLSLVMTLIFAFGIAFQLPVLLVLLVRAGLITTQDLIKRRKYAIVLGFIFAAILTPPDIISQICLGGSIIILYEISIQVAKLIEKPS